MVGLTLVSELIFEAVKFVVMLGLLVLAVFAGGKIRKGLDAKKAAKQEEQGTFENEELFFSST